MSMNVYNRITEVILFAAGAAIIVAGFSLVMMILRWRSHRRKYAIRFLSALASCAVLVGVQQALLWLIYLPSLEQEQLGKQETAKALRLRESSVVAVGDPVPDFSLASVDGVGFSMAEVRGKVVVINFFATWCGPCRRELPHLEELWRRYKGNDGFRLIVIGRDETEETVRAFRSENGFTFPIAADPDKQVYALFATQLIPRTLIVSSTGAIVYSKAGFAEEELDELNSTIHDQLSKVK